MLDDRKTAILGAVIQEYIATAQPVGSTHIADAPQHPGVVGDRAQRDESARVRGLSSCSRTRPPVASRPTRAIATTSTTSPRPGRLDRATTRQVGDFFSAAHGRLEETVAPDLEPARRPDEQRRRRRRSEGRGHSDSQRAGGVAVVDCSPRSSPSSRTAPSRTSRSNIDERDDDVRLAAASAHLSAALSGTVLGAVSQVSTRPAMTPSIGCAGRLDGLGTTRRPATTSSPAVCPRSPTRSTPSRSSGRCCTRSSSSSSSSRW